MKKEIIPILISILLLLYSIGITLLTNYVLNYKHYLGISLIGISTILYFKNKKLFAYIFGLTLVLGITNLIDIYYSNIIFSIGPINFNPIFLALLIIFLALNKEQLNEMFPEKELTEQELADKNIEAEKLIKSYQLKFKSKPESELKNIADENSGYVNEAKTAAQRILKAKNVL
ncbi:hypothetical protein [Aquimarina algicola]|uniref:Uncharacterized protein n=1 Tax=Aquimarina algicola TaxID=2589995 RepID=A0A504JEA8_9FLAO|nr:hypothetical protein [Aquimarina algicola]TPN86048.1 hypothetical protein FHK87_12290 [Aquimarina algicola]